MSDIENEGVKTEEDKAKNAQMTAECIGKMVDNIECRISAKMQKMFLPSLAVFSSIVIGMFAIIYSITVDMSRVAGAMDGEKGVNNYMLGVSKNMAEMTKIMQSMTDNVEKMNVEFQKTNVLLGEMNAEIKNLDKMSKTADRISDDVKEMTKAVASIGDINNNIGKITAGMQNIDRSVYGMGSDIRRMKNTFNGPMNIMDKMPFPF